jgi:hypothetical protein
MKLTFQNFYLTLSKSTFQIDFAFSNSNLTLYAYIQSSHGITCLKLLFNVNSNMIFLFKKIDTRLPEILTFEPLSNA